MTTKRTRGRPKKSDRMEQISTNLRKDQVDSLNKIEGPEDTRASLIREGVDMIVEKRECMHSTT